MKPFLLCLLISSVFAQAVFARPTHTTHESFSSLEKEKSSEESPVALEGRTLSRHDFLQTSIVLSPFITDEVAMTFSGGLLSISPDPQTSFQFAGFAPTLQFKKSVGSWVALTAGVNATMLAATNSETAGILAESAAYGVEPGFLVRVFRTEAQTLALAMTASFGNQYSLSPATGLQNINNTGTVNFNSLLVKNNQTSWNPGLRYAVGFFDMMGLELDSKVVINTTSTQGQDPSTDTSIRAGASFSFDLKPRTPIPLGFAVGYAHDFAVSQKAVDTHNIEMGVYETISRSFNFGGAFTMTLASLRSLYAGGLSMRYYY